MIEQVTKDGDTRVGNISVGVTNHYHTQSSLLVSVV